MKAMALFTLTALISIPYWANAQHSQESIPPSPCQSRYPNLPKGDDGFNYLLRRTASTFNHEPEIGRRAIKEELDMWTKQDCRFDDGRSYTSTFLWGLKMAFALEPDWSLSSNRVKSVKAMFPDQAFSVITEAKYWTSYAWNARGTGYINSVTPDGYRLFIERMKNAEKILIDGNSYGKNMPQWYELMLEIQGSLGRPSEEMYETFKEGASRYKNYYPIYFQMENYLEPKWRGNWKIVDQFISWSVENTKETEGESMYSRLYWAAGQGMPPGENLFKATHANWKKMKKGFEDLMIRTPNSMWNLNNFAAFSCLAEDRATFLKLRKEIGPYIHPNAWINGRSLESCEATIGAN